jgi:hypothetical protein
MKPPPLDRPAGFGPFNLACEGCDTGLWRGERFGGSEPVYCHTCYQRLWRAKHRHKLRTCVTCGTEFTTTRVDAKFCSNACRQKAHRGALAHP